MQGGDSAAAGQQERLGDAEAQRNAAHLSALTACFQQLGATPFYQKRLTASDVATAAASTKATSYRAPGKVVLPKVCVRPAGRPGRPPFPPPAGARRA
jgi:hypothetical protein